MSSSFIDKIVVYMRNKPTEMEGRPSSGCGTLRLAAVVVASAACWRALSELIARHRALVASGELARRLELRGATAMTRALASAGVTGRGRAVARVPVPVSVAPLAAAAPAADGGHRVLAAVSVGTVRPTDVDDVGLLEGAMRRAAVERMDVSATGVRRRARRRARRSAQRGVRHLAADVLAAAPASDMPEPSRGSVAVAAARARATSSAASAPVAVDRPALRPARRDGGWTDWRWLAGDVEVATDADAPAWPLPTAVLGVVMTVVPVTRPFADAAPWLALAGLALVLGAWLGARRSWSD